MKQIIQSFKTGETILEELPASKVKSGQVLVKTTKSLVSLGTERMLVEFGKANLVSKARQQPDKVKMVLDKVKAEGLMPTLETVFNKLGQPLPLGYCNVGKVVAIGKGVTEFKVGDRVASNGPHAEYVSVPKNLVAHIPDKVSDAEASFTVIGSIGLQGIRLASPTLGETFVVTGLGLIGLMTAQMLRANGCKVIGIDLDAKKCKMARELGIQVVNPGQGEDPVKSVMDITNGTGADGVLITASSKSNDIVSQAAQMSRKRGRIILVGVVGLNLSRAEFYEKELTFQVSCSYGPGRYDDDYEQKGIDYPLPFVRWTEKRNFEAVLQAIAEDSINVRDLISEEVPLAEYQKIYGDIGNSSSIASILTYSGKEEEPDHSINLNPTSYEGQKGVIGVVGAGNFTKMTMLPALKGSGAGLKYIASAGGLNGTDLAKKFGFSNSTTDYKVILKDETVDALFITTRHNSHASMAVEGLKAGKHVFVEKPLALDLEGLEAVTKARETASKSVTVGFNRRFSPHIQRIKKALGHQSSPVNIVATMNAGFIPPEVWVHDLQVGGGRIIGEACHYLDLCVYLSGSEIESVCMNALGTNPAENTDNVSILVRFQNGSNAAVNYFANGSKAYSKERLELYSQDRTFVMDNFRQTKGYGVKGFKNLKTKMDKGHKAQFHAYIDRLKKGGEPLIPFSEIHNVTKASFAALESIRKGSWVKVSQL